MLEISWQCLFAKSAWVCYYKLSAGITPYYTFLIIILELDKRIFTSNICLKVKRKDGILCWRDCICSTLLSSKLFLLYYHYHIQKLSKKPSEKFWNFSISD